MYDTTERAHGKRQHLTRWFKSRMKTMLASFCLNYLLEVMGDHDLRRDDQLERSKLHPGKEHQGKE